MTPAQLIYVYDGLLDFQNDSKAGIFNCLSACYLNKDKDIRRISIEIFDFIENTRNNISSVLENIEFENNDNLIKGIFLQDFEMTGKMSMKFVQDERAALDSSCFNTTWSGDSGCCCCPTGCCCSDALVFGICFVLGGVILRIFTGKWEWDCSEMCGRKK